MSSSEGSDTSSDSADDEDKKEERVMTPKGKRSRAGQNDSVEVSIQTSYNDHTIECVRCHQYHRGPFRAVFSDTKNYFNYILFFIFLHFLK